MESARSLISITALHDLLMQLKEQRPDICFRYRLLGEMWCPNFMAVIAVTKNSLLLTNTKTHKLLSISQISNIMQFELDKSFMGYQPFFHYEVHTLELKNAHL